MTSDPERDARLNITGGPPPLPVRKPFPVVRVLGACLAGMLVLGFIVTRVGDDKPSPPSYSVAPASEPGLPNDALQGLAAGVAHAVFGGDRTDAVNMLAGAETIAGCDLTAYMHYREPGDFADHRVRRVIIRDAGRRGWDVAFGKWRDQWLVIAQVCT